MLHWSTQDWLEFQELRATAQSNHQLLTELLAHQRKMMALLDSEVTLLGTIDANVLNVITEIQALKSSNPTVDTTALDAAIAKLQTDVATAATDAAAPTPAASSPTPTPTPTSSTTPTT